MLQRKSWDKYFIELANLVSTRSTCDRKHVGAVITYRNRVISTGYNGSLPGLAHCDDIGHDLEDGHCVATVHAEQNAILQAAKMGIPTENCTIYCNTLPCWNCFKVIVTAGITRVVYQDSYNLSKSGRMFQAAKELGVTIAQVDL